ncbi:GNAT family N-acetyltransferase [Actinocorallia longicatena]|uniref:N-acetyltransferase domain-containing protein n=1 Tax=Actinocorallia longicatena TaxID=111803 RepID=A0ABP6QCM6_9ACTN
MTGGRGVPPSVLFVGVHDAGRSPMAAAFLAHLSGGRVPVRSAGSAPAERVGPVVVEAMREAGIDVSAAVPQAVSGEHLEASDVVVTLGCGDACPVPPGRLRLDWVLPDPAGLGLDAVRPIRDEIGRRVRGLLDDLGVPVTGARVAAMLPEHAGQVLEIYQAGIDTGDATFEKAAPSWSRFDATRLPAHRLVALGADGRVLGWAAVVRVSDRCAYSGVVEHSLYVHPEARGRGVGTVLLTALLASTDAAGVWTVQSGIFPENAASLALHARAGFRTVGVRERVGRQGDRWRDVVLLERRSPAVG